MIDLKGGEKHEKTFKWKGAYERGFLLGWAEKDNERKPREGMPQVKELKKLKLLVRQLSQEVGIWYGGSVRQSTCLPYFSDIDISS